MGITQCCDSERPKQNVDLDAKIGLFEFAFPNGFNEKDTIDYFVKNWELKTEQEKQFLIDEKAKAKKTVKERLELHKELFNKKKSSAQDLEDALSIRNSRRGRRTVLNKHRDSATNLGQSPHVRRTIHFNMRGSSNNLVPSQFYNGNSILKNTKNTKTIEIPSSPGKTSKGYSETSNLQHNQDIDGQSNIDNNANNNDNNKPIQIMDVDQANDSVLTEDEKVKEEEQLVKKEEVAMLMKHRTAVIQRKSVVMEHFVPT